MCNSVSLVALGMSALWERLHACPCVADLLNTIGLFSIRKIHEGMILLVPYTYLYLKTALMYVISKFVSSGKSVKTAVATLLRTFKTGKKSSRNVTLECLWCGHNAVLELRAFKENDPTNDAYLCVDISACNERNWSRGWKTID